MAIVALGAACMAAAQVPGERPEKPLDGMWKFYPAFVEIEFNNGFLAEGLGAEAAQPGWTLPEFDDSAWWDIPVPSSWNTAFDDLWSYEGTGWYRTKAAIPADWAGRHVEFVSDGANYHTVVYVNGHRAGEHEGGYTAFSIPIDPWLKPGAPNTIAVSVNNESRLDRVPMERHDWWNHGGLYRPVRLIAMAPAHIASVTAITGAEAEPAYVQVHVALEAAPEGPAPAHLEAVLYDADGQRAAVSAVAVLDVDHATLDLALPDARRWTPDTPYLYRLEVLLRPGPDTAPIDRYETRIGMRTIRVSGTKLLLNGEPLVIKGVNRYENYPDTGMTSTPENLATDLELIKGLGANAVRCHYPFAPETYARLDEVGLLAVCEVPLYQWGRPGHSEKNLDAAMHQLEAMIATLRNHPSVAMWSVSNETRIRPREPGEEHERLSQMVAAGNLALVARARELDPSRPVIEPSNRWPEDVVLEATDLSSVNVYLGVPEPHVDALPAMPGLIRERLQALRDRIPGKPILVTEFGSWALRGLHTDYFPGEAYQAELLRTFWETFAEMPDFAGGFVWCFADSDVHRKFTTIYEMRCAYGLYDLHRRPKQSAAVMRSLWTGAP